jgi:hypothetical protein
MKRIIVTMAVCAAGLAQAGFMDPTWAGDDGTAYAVWDDWANFSPANASLADYTEAYDHDGTLMDYPGTDAPDVFSQTAVNDYDLDGNSWLVLGDTDDLSFWMPTLNGYDTTEAVIQLTYWDDLDNAGWRPDLALFPQLSDASSGQLVTVDYLGENHDTDAGLITEAWGLTAAGATDGFFFDFTVSQDDLDLGGMFVEEVSVDAISYAAIPEPASIASILFGGVILTMYRRRFRG